jgi:hypothetical protein
MVADTGNQIGAVELMQEMVRFFGLRRTSELLGYVVIWTAIGEPNPELARQEELGHRASHYRALADFGRLGAKLRAEGRLPPSKPESDRRRDVAEVVELIRASGAAFGGGA